MRFKYINSVRRATLAVAVMSCTGYVCLLPAVADTSATDKRFAGAPGTEEYPLANAIFLDDDLSYTVRPDGSALFSEHDIIKLLTNDGVRLHNNVTRQFDSRYEEVKVIKAQTITPDGKVLPVPESAIVTDNAAEDPAYDYIKEIKIEFPHCVTSAIIEYELATVRKSGADKYWWQSSWMENLDPILQSRFTLSVPQGTKFSSHAASGIKATPKKNIAGQDVYVWTRDEKGTFVAEYAMPDALNYLKNIETSSFRSWDDFARWYGSLWDSAISQTDKFGFKITSISSNSKPKKERICDVLDWYSSHYSTEAISLSPYFHTPNELLECKAMSAQDTAILIAAVLKQYGIDAYPVLAGDYMADGNLSQRPPSLDKFNSIVLRIMGENGNDWWINPTDGCLLSDAPPCVFQLKEALYLASGEQQPGLKLLGTSAPASNMRDIRLDVMVDDRTADIALNVTLNGENAARWRALLMCAKNLPATKRDNLRTYLAQIINDDFSVPASFYSFYFPESTELDAPITLSTTTMSAGLASGTQDHEYSMPVAIYGGDRLTSLLTNQTKRTKPVDLGHPFIDEIRTHVKLPDTAKITAIPKDMQIETPYGSFRSFTRQQGREIWQYNRIEIKQALTEVKDLDKLMPLVKAQSDNFNSLLKFTMPPSPKKESAKDKPEVPQTDNNGTPADKPAKDAEPSPDGIEVPGDLP